MLILNITNVNNSIIEMRIRNIHINIPNNTNITNVRIQELICTNNKTYKLLQYGYNFGYTFNSDLTLNSSIYTTCKVDYKFGSCKIINNTVCNNYKLDGIYYTSNYKYKTLYLIDCKNRNYYIWGSSVLRTNLLCFKILD